MRARSEPKRTIALTAGLAAVWFVQLNALYFLVPHACRIGTRAPLHAISAVALVLVVALGRPLRHAVSARSFDRVAAPPYGAALAATWVIVFVAVVLLAVSALAVDPCR